jgi:hypothetical protein
VAIGVLLLAFLFEMIIGQLAPGWIKWQFTQNLTRFASRANDFPEGRSIGGAGILLSIYAAGLFALTALGFNRRDVA